MVRVPTKHSWSKPKAYLNCVLLDEAQLAYVAAGSGAKQVGDDKVATLLSTTIEVPRNGYLYIYTSNETKNIDVYFDNLQLSHTRSPLLEENNYYAFGGDIKALCSKAMKGLAYINNNAKFNSGTEFNDDLDIALYETPFRNYNAQIGRFQGIDQLSELTPSLTPTQFGGNNPISFNDPSGLAFAAFVASKDDDSGGSGSGGKGGGGDGFNGAADLGTVTVGGTIPSSPSVGSISFGSPSGINYGNNSDNVISYHFGCGGSSGSSGYSKPDGWIQDGSSYKYVDDPNVGVKEKDFIDPLTGKTMHGDKNGNLVEVPQELMDAIVSGTRHKDGATVYVESDGLGHAYLETKGTVFSYGRYDGSYSPSSGTFDLVGHGVLLKKSHSFLLLIEIELMMAMLAMVYIIAVQEGLPSHQRNPIPLKKYKNGTSYLSISILGWCCIL